MKYEEISKYSDKKFKRVVGVNRTTFKRMLEILEEEYEQRHLRGRSTKLSLEDMLLVAMGMRSGPTNRLRRATSWQPAMCAGRLSGLKRYWSGMGHFRCRAVGRIRSRL